MSDEESPCAVDGVMVEVVVKTVVAVSGGVGGDEGTLGVRWPLVVVEGVRV